MSPRPPASFASRRLLPLALLVACGGAPSALTPPAPSPRPAAAPPPASSASPAAEAPAPYDGHGAASVSPEVVASFRPRPLEPELARRVETMLDLRGPTNLVPAADGKALYFAWNVTGTAQVWRVDGPRAFPVQVTGGEDPTVPVAALAGGRGVVVSRDRKGEENPGLYVALREGGPLKVLQHRPGVQTRFHFASDDGRRIYYSANDRRPDAYALWRFDVDSGTRELLLDEPGLWSVDDHRGEAKLLLARATGALTREYFELDVATKEPLPVLGHGETEEYEAAYARDPGELIVLTNKGGDRRRLHRYRYGSAGPGFGELRPVSPDVPHDVTGFRVDVRRTRVTYTTNEGGYARPAVLDAATLKPIKAPSFAAGGEAPDHVLLGAFSADGSRQAALVRAPGALAAAWLVDHRTGTASPWVLPAAPEVDLRSFAKAEPAPYVARDGTTIPAFVRQSERCRLATEPCPVLVHFHGGPEGQALPGLSAWAQIWVDAGYVLYEPNVRGSDGYGKAWLHADDGPKRLDVITDIQDAGRYVRRAFARNGVEPRVGVFGGSYGGYSALVGMTLFAGTFDAGASNVGMSDLGTFLRNTAPYRRALRVTEYGDPDRDREALAKLSPVTYLDRVGAPVLLLQGVSDPRVPVGEALQIHRALVKRRVPSELVLFADEGHGTQKRENKVLEIGRTLSFFEAHLRPPPPRKDVSPE